MLNLTEYKKFMHLIIEDLTDMELYNSINHEEEVDNNIHQIKVRGITFTFNASTYELYEMGYGCNQPEVGNTIFKNKNLDDKIEETGYEFP